MKRFVPFVALLALVALVGCSGNSPSAKPVPTVVPSDWAITSLDVSDSSPFVGTVILVEATVTKNGSPAPDGTTVTFEATGGDFLPGGGTRTSVASSGGTASIDFGASVAGSYGISALVSGASRSVTVTYHDRAVTDKLQLFGVNPSRGSYGGGEEVVITGKGILAPVEAFFDLPGREYQAIVIGVEESNPPSAEGSVTVIAPTFSGADNTKEQVADVRVIAGVGVGDPQTDTLPQSYLLLPSLGPLIFGVSPSSGRSSGGEEVSVLGQGFGSVATDLVVSFVGPDEVPKVATVLAVTPDGTSIQVITPRFSTLPLPDNVLYDVQVLTVDSGTRLDDAFVVLADEPQPVITSIAPIEGPLDGGTSVTIFGGGFQTPAQVWFGTRTADISEVLANRITCTTPDYSGVGDVPPVTVDVKVINLDTGKNATLGGAFTFGDELSITGNTPTEGQLGTLVDIFGTGFISPLQVFWVANGRQMDFLGANENQVRVRVPEDWPTTCDGEESGAFRVLLLGTAQEVEGGNFTLLGNRPRVLSVSPVILSAVNHDPGDLNPDSITISGQNFTADVVVQLGGYMVPSGNVSVVSRTAIAVSNLPNTSTLGIVFDTTTSGCPAGQVRDINPIAVDVTVTNFPGSCDATLANAFTVEPFPDCYTP